MPLDYQSLLIKEDELIPIRASIYDPDKPGYHLFRGFLAREEAQRMARFWCQPINRRRHKRYIGPYGIFDGCPNYVTAPRPGTRSFFNFFWNPPADELTYSVAQQVVLLRNRIEGRPTFREFFPLERRSVSFRVVVDRSGSNLVPPHRDWMGKYLDPRRTQVTLFLSEKGRDYTGSGFMFENNQGNKLSMGTDVEVNAGDLMVWRYNNEHSVDTVSSTPEQPGFVRIVFPPEYIHPRFPLEVTALPIVSNVMALAHTGRNILRKWEKR